MNRKTRERKVNNPLSQKEISNSIRRSLTFKSIKESVPLNVRKKMESVKIDFSKDNIFPELNEVDIRDFGLKPLKVRLKKGIIGRQEFRHSDIKDIDANMLLASALYSPTIVSRSRREEYIHFARSLGNNDNALVLLDIREVKDEDGNEFYDIVHFFFVSDERRKTLAGK